MCGLNYLNSTFGHHWRCHIFLVPGDFLKTLQDKDINVRRVALVMFNSAAHNKPGLIRELLGSVLPHLYSETQIRKDLIREVWSPELVRAGGMVELRS